MKQCELYNREQLQRLLDDALPDASEQNLSDHLAVCPACQQELQSLAAADNWWSEATTRLSSSATDERPSNSRGENHVDLDFHCPSDPAATVHRARWSPAGPNSTHDDEVYATDFAVDFLEPSDDPKVLGRLGDCDIIEVIGRGGMGVVLKGFQKELNRFVAVKVLAPQLATSGAARRRFAREAQATAAVVNPHVMAIHSVHANSKLPYLVMPFVACESLQQRVDRHGPLDVLDILRIGMQAAQGLAAAHAQGLVHRDVKPANILLETNVDRVMLTDFGLARAVDDATLTRTGIIAGTPQYMSPEQANGEPIDHRSDLFSLGSVLYSMCTGRPPFRAETTFGVLRRIRETPPRSIREINPEIPDWLERVVFQLLAKQADDRPPTAEGTASTLQQCLAHWQQPTAVALPAACTAVAAEPVPRYWKSIPARVIQLALLSLFAGLITLIATVAPWRSRAIQYVELPAQSSATGETADPLLGWDQPQQELSALNYSLSAVERQLRDEVDIESGDAVEATPVETELPAF